MFANIPGNAIGMAMITVIGQCIGAKKPDEAKRYGKNLCLLHMQVFLQPTL
ncbi:MAG: MATE family efflux transporter [Lachnospira eligens]